MKEEGIHESPIFVDVTLPQTKWKTAFTYIQHDPHSGNLIFKEMR